MGFPDKSFWIMFRFYLHRFHVEHFGDPALHDQEVRVVDIDADQPEQIRDALIGGRSAVDLIGVLPVDDDLNKNILFRSISNFKFQFYKPDL